MYAPGGHGGLEIHDTRVTQIIAHLEALLKLGTDDRLGGQLMRASIECTKLELGLPGDLFQHDYNRYKDITTDCWVKAV